MERPITHSQWPKRFAWFLVFLVAGMGVAAIVLYILNRDTPTPPSWGTDGGVRNTPADLVNIVIQVGLALTSGFLGALIVGRRPRHRIGWLVIAIGLITSAMSMLEGWTLYGYYTTGEPLLGLGLAGWITNWAWIALFGNLLWMLAIFPSGTMLSRRWGWLTGVPIGVFVIFALMGAMIETPMSSAFQAPNPFVSERFETLYNVLFMTGVGALGMAIVAVLTAVLARFRQSQGRERQQMKWLMAGVSLMALMAIGGGILSLGLGFWPGGILVNSSVLGPLLGIGVAMLRHRLYDIDLIIRRTLIYSVLTALLGLIYFSSVVVLQSVVTAVSGRPSSLIIVLSTLAIAVLFSPLRRRVQEVIDRRFFRSKYDAEQMLSQFAQTARGEAELDRLGQELLTVVGETMQPERAWLWLRDEGGDEGLVMAKGAGAPYRSRAS